MTANEALEYARIALWSTRGREAYEALAAVVEDYEKARPLLCAASNMAKDANYDDMALLISEARHYQKSSREGRKA